MIEGFPFLDILLFAMVAAYLVFRLRSVLGRRTGEERRRLDRVSAPHSVEEKEETVVKLPKRGKRGRAAEEERAEPALAPGSVEGGLAQIRIADPDFNERDFLAGAKAAFEMIVGAFASGDRKVLRRLLADEVYGHFVREIEGRESAGREHETTVIGIDSATIAEARLKDREAFVGVEFVSEQVNVTRDAEGRIVEGDPNEVQRVTDLWTFSRDATSSDPNWILVATRSPE